MRTRLLFASPALALTRRLYATLPKDTSISYTILTPTTTLPHQTLPKATFLKLHNLYPRDLRKIDTSAIDAIPSLIVRDKGFLVNLLHVKALVEKERVIVFDTGEEIGGRRLGMLVYDLENKLKQTSAHVVNAQNHVPHTSGGAGASWSHSFEHRVLESILINVMTTLESELQLHKESCGRILARLEDEIDRDELRELLIKSKKLSAFCQKAVLIRNVLDEILDNDEDLRGIYLSDKVKIPERTDFGEAEMLLESYYKQSDEFVQQSTSLLSDIKSTEEIINIILDANRNSLMLFELKVTIYTLGFTVATLLPAFYGMNLENFIEETNWGFASVIWVSIALGLLVTSLNFRTLRGVQKLTLMGGRKPGKVKPKNKFWGRRSVGEGSGERDIVWRWLVDDKQK